MKRILIATAAVAALAPGLASAASILIDDFDGSQRAIDVPSGSLTSANQAAVPSAPGGFRDLQASNDDGFEDATELRVLGGSLRFSNIAGTSGSGTLTYDGDDLADVLTANGLGGFDLTFGGLGTGFIYEVISADAQLDLTVNVTDMTGGFSTFMTVLPAGIENQFITGSFADFVGTADLTNLGSLQFVAGANGVEDLDAQIGSISVAIIPLPAGVFLLGGALFGLGAAARRRKA